MSGLGPMEQTMPSRVITQELYQRVLGYYRENPGDAVGCATATGLHHRTARRLWRGPASKLWPWCVPVQEVLAREKTDALEREERAKEKERLALAEDAARARKLAEEAQRFEDQSMAVARVDALQGLAALSHLGKGIGVQAKRLAVSLEAVDPKAPVDPAATMRLLRDYVLATRTLTDVAETLIGVGRAARDLPRAQEVLEIGSATIEDAKRDVDAAQRALARAAARGLMVVEGGK